MNVVIINGSGGCGKDTFVELCRKNSDFPVVCVSSVDRVKEAAAILGWDGGKDERARRFLSDLKDAATDYCDSPMRYLTGVFLNEGICHEQGILFMMIREPREIERAAQRFEAVTLLIKRPSVASISSNHADAFVDAYDYDYTVFNNGTLDDFENQAKHFVKLIHDGYFERRKEHDG